MRRRTKINFQPERKDVQKGQKPASQSQKPLTSNLVNLAMTEPEKLSPGDVVRLQGLIGNQAVTHLMTYRQDDPRGGELFTRPRTRSLSEGAAQRRVDMNLQDSPAQRGLVFKKAVSDAANLDGSGLHGWNREIVAEDVAILLSNLLQDQSNESTDETQHIAIFSGTHGLPDGNLINIGAGSFVSEDKATAQKIMSENPKAEIEVIDVNSYKTKDDLTKVFDMTDYVRILAWCHSSASYLNKDALKSNWWPEPDHCAPPEGIESEERTA